MKVPIIWPYQPNQYYHEPIMGLCIVCASPVYLTSNYRINYLGIIIFNDIAGKRLGVPKKRKLLTNFRLKI